MQEIGLESSLLQHVINGTKTIELRLGTPRFIKLRKGMDVSIREDVWQDGAIVSSNDSGVTIHITQILYFESFEEAFGAINFQAALPEATSKADAIKTCRQFYAAADEYEHGVMAISFDVVA